MIIGKIRLKYYKEENAYNDAKNNPRTIEIPLGKYFMDKFGGDMLEVGAVMPYYYKCPHAVLDLYDSFPDCIREDATTYDYSGKNVLCISTIEHIGYNDYSKNKYYDTVEASEFNKIDSFNCLKSIISNASNYLITVPIGYNSFLDDRVKEARLDKIIVRRVNRENKWEVDPDKYNMDYKFGKPYGSANALCIYTNLEEFNMEK